MQGKLWLISIDVRRPDAEAPRVVFDRRPSLNDAATSAARTTARRQRLRRTAAPPDAAGIRGRQGRARPRAPRPGRAPARPHGDIGVRVVFSTERRRVEPLFRLDRSRLRAPLLADATQDTATGLEVIADEVRPRLFGRVVPTGDMASRAVRQAWSLSRANGLTRTGASPAQS